LSKKKPTEKEAEEKEERALFAQAVEAVAKIPPDVLSGEPDEIIKRLSTVEFARQVLGPDILRRPDWPVLWCRLICWIKYIICVLHCPPFLRDVLIRSVGRVDSVNPLVPDGKLMANPATGEETPVGGVISVSGSANITGAGRKIQAYRLWYAPYDGALDKWVDAPFDHTPLPAGWKGPVSEIEYVPPHEQTWSCFPLGGSNVVSNGDLTRMWEKATCSLTSPPTDFWWLDGHRWNTTVPDVGSGRFTALLMVEDDLGGVYYDSQRVWIDNQAIVGVIDGIQGVKPCEDLKLSMKRVHIEGEAYDPPIDATITPLVAPNDNFNYYRLWFRKQNATTPPVYREIPPGAITTPVGPGVGVLVDWDLTMLDAVTNPLGLPADQLLVRGEACPYTLRLYVRDKTHVNDTATPHYVYDNWPIKIVNDLG
jgi:hypothetical protein